MPRHGRLDIKGAVYHVISRGWNRQTLYKDSCDRNEFLRRLAESLNQTGCRCYAWVLMNNHFHLLLSPLQGPLSTLLRKLLTGYAVYFNRRHGRTGYLFQNRYKSILCQKDAYWLELIRYIHLNPVRAGVVGSLEALDRFPWSGHSALMGKGKREWQAVDEVLLHFNQARAKARARYRQYLKEGWEMGKREELTGGGFKRSTGGWEGIKTLGEHVEYWRGDERILGDEQFVKSVLKQGEGQLTLHEKYRRAGWTLERLKQTVCNYLSINAGDIGRRGRGNALSHARSLIAYLGYEKLGIQGKELAQFLGITRSSLTSSIARGRKLAEGKSLID